MNEKEQKRKKKDLLNVIKIQFKKIDKARFLFFNIYFLTNFISF
jgi:hypothetical protein